MYSVYKYAAGATKANVLADVIAILTGETDVNNLSASCDKANTSITTSWHAAGWSSYDAAAGTNAKCIRAAYHDDAASYSYVGVDTNTDGYIFLVLYESWNNGSHLGGNIAYNSNSATYAQRLNLASGGALYLHAGLYHVFCKSYQSAAWGSSYNNCPILITQRTRLSPADTVANGYPNTVFSYIGHWGSSAAAASTPRMLKNDGSDVTGSNAGSIEHVTYFGSGIEVAVQTPLDVDKNLRHLMMPIIFRRSGYAWLGGECSSLNEIYFITQGSGVELDEREANGNVYVLFSFGTQSPVNMMAVRKG